MKVLIYRVVYLFFIVSWTNAIAAPNILLVIADDMGFDQSSLYVDSPTVPPMPVIDELASRGIVYENAWSSPSCTPTRATMLTGQYGFRNGVDSVIHPSRPKLGFGNKLDNPYYLPQQLKRLGYQSAIFGKWHVSQGPSDPISMGFDHWAGTPRSFGIRDGVPKDSVAAYFSTVHDTYRCNPECEKLKFQVPPNPAPVADKFNAQYMTSWIVDESLDWIEAQSESEPWFLWLAFQAPHLPTQLPPVHLVDPGLVEEISSYFGNYEPGHWARLGEDPEGARLVFRAMISALDTETGRLLEAIDLSETVVIFMGDNGTVAQLADPAFVPPRRGKGSLYEGGIHVPFIVSGANIVDPGRRSEALVHTSDIYTTVLNLAGAGINEEGTPEILPEELIIDGRSLVPTFNSRAGVILNRDVIFSSEGMFPGTNPGYPKGKEFLLPREGKAVRNDNYKLIEMMAKDERGSFICRQDPQPTAENPMACDSKDRMKNYELYDIKSDPLELHNLLDGEPVLSDKLQTVYKDLRTALTLIVAE